MLAVFFQKLTSRWSLRVPSQPIATMPLFSFTDLQFIAVDWRLWLDIARHLRIIRKNLSICTEAGLNGIYPRSHLLAYVYLSVSWARYSRVLDPVLRNPDQGILAEMFLRYICQMDSYVDSFDSRELLRKNLRSITRLPLVKQTLSELYTHLEQLNLPGKYKIAILRAIASYRHNYFKALLRWVDNTHQTLAEVITDKEGIAGDLWRTWSCLLGYLYQIPPDVAEYSARMMFTLGMIIQVIDDIWDAPADYAVRSANLFLAVVQEHPLDWEHLETHLKQQPTTHISWPWVRENIPKSYQETMKLYRTYTECLLNDTHNPQLTLELHQTVERMLRLTG